jgi:hypothetical protein
MKPFSNNRTKRSTAFVALLVWLFALASGMANACLLEAPAPHSHAGADGYSVAGHAPAALAGHSDSIDDHDDDSDAAKESCLKTCNEGSNAPVKLQTGFDLTDPGPAPLIATVWSVATPVVSAPCRLDDLQPAIVGPPLRVRYSRLAL